MTHLKKSLAVLLAFVMIFSTMSIAASAFDPAVDGGFDLGFTVVMFRKDGSGNWIQTTKAKPGEELKAVLYIGSDFDGNSSTLSLVWDKEYMSSKYAYKDNVSGKVKVNGNYIVENGVNIASLYSDNVRIYDEELKTSRCTFLENYGYAERGYFNTHDIMLMTLLVREKENMKWDKDTWAVEWEFTVNDNAYVRNSANQGEVKVPIEFACTPERAPISAETQYDFFLDFPKGTPGGNRSDNTSMYDYPAVLSSTPGIISVFNNINLNANGGKFADNSAVKAISGVIGDTVTGLFDSANLPTNGGKQFLGWAKTADATAALTQAELADLAYDYDEQELFAVWSDEVTNTSWKYEVYKMALVTKSDGSYTGEYLQAADYVSPATAVAVNTPITAPVETYEGFELDTDKSVLSGVAQAGSDNVLKVYYKREVHSVTYYDEDKQSVLAKYENIPYGAPVPAAPESPEGYDVTWTPEIPATVGTKDLEFTAKLTPKTYTLTFNAQEGAFTDGLKIKTFVSKYGDPVRLLDDIPVLDGYIFTGWQMIDGIKIPEKVTEDLTFYAGYSKLYTVSFDTDGGNEIPDEEHCYDDEIDSFPTPTKDNAVFVGWTYNGERITYPFRMPDSDITLKAQWEYTGPVTARLNYEFTGTVPAGAEALLPSPSSHEVGSLVNLEGNPGLEGYEFHGWYYEGEEVSSIIMPANGATVTGYWTEAPHQQGTINFYDGDDIYKTISGDLGAEANAPEAPTKEGYTFVGWVDANGGEVTFPVRFTEDGANYYAKWQKTALTVTYYLIQGGEEPYAVQSYKTGDTITPATLPEGYEAEGWVDANGNPLPAVMGTEDIVVYAKNLKTKSYNLTFDANGGHFGDDEANTVVTSQVPYGAEVKRPTAPVRDGYVFAGWEPNVEAVMPNHDVIYTAKWEKAPVEGETYLATYYVTEGDPCAQYVLKEGDVIPVPATPQRFGYKFVGWEPEVPSTMPANDVEFVAQWEVDKEFVTVVIGGTVIAGGVIATIAGINAALITGAAIIGGIITIAIIAKNTYTVKYIVDGETYKTYKVLAGTKIPVPADPTKEGYVFDGWDPEVPDKMPAADQTFTAKWKAAADDDIPATGSASAGLAAFGIISAAAAAAYVMTKKKRED